MKISNQIIEAFLTKLNDYHELHSLEFLENDSNQRFQSYKLEYINNLDELKPLRVEFDLEKNKASYGEWDGAAMQTIKLDLS